MSKHAFDKIAEGLEEAREIVPLLYERERFRYQIYSIVMWYMLKSDLSAVRERLGRRGNWLDEWVASPDKWTLEVASDLMVAMGHDPGLLLRDPAAVATQTQTSGTN